MPFPKDALFIGGGVYSYPTDYINYHTTATLDVVEIDPEVTAIAKEYFYFIENPRINIFHEDGRTFLNRNIKKYDIVFLDAFNSHLSIPFQLSTFEAVEHIYNALNDEGILVANFASAIEGKKGKFLRAEVATYKKIFPHVLLFPVQKPHDGEAFQNIVLIALKSGREPDFKNEDPELNDFLKRLWLKTVPEDLPILIDDHAPVNYYTMEMINL